MPGGGASPGTTPLGGGAAGSGTTAAIGSTTSAAGCTESGAGDAAGARTGDAGTDDGSAAGSESDPGSPESRRGLEPKSAVAEEACTKAAAAAAVHEASPPKHREWGGGFRTGEKQIQRCRWGAALDRAQVTTPPYRLSSATTGCTWGWCRPSWRWRWPWYWFACRGLPGLSPWHAHSTGKQHGGSMENSVGQRYRRAGKGESIRTRTTSPRGGGAGPLGGGAGPGMGASEGCTQHAKRSRTYQCQEI
jgi:hypothetical protein